MSEEARCTTERLRADADHLLRLFHGQTNDFWELLAVVGRVSARVGRLEAMLANSGSASSAPPASDAAGTEPVAWMCEWTDYMSFYESKTQAERSVQGDVVVPQPLYRTPPQTASGAAGNSPAVPVSSEQTPVNPELPTG